MPAEVKLSLLLLAFFSPCVGAQVSLCRYGATPQLVFSNVTLNRDTPSQNVTLTCRHPPGRRNNHSLALSWTSDTSLFPTRLVLADKNAVRDLRIVPNSRITGNFTKAIRFTLANVSCTSPVTGTFTCRSVSIPQGYYSLVACVKATRLSPEPDSSDVRLKAEPDSGTYSVGDILTLTCDATVGLTSEENARSRTDWVWQKKKDGEEDWTNVTEDVALGSLSTVDDCFKVRTTTLELALDTTHDGLTYRCYTIDDGKALISAARSYSIKVDSFLFGQNMSLGLLLLFDIIVIILSVGAAVFIGYRFLNRRNPEDSRS